MPILDIQRRARELGRIRIGQVVTGTNKQGKEYTRPDKLDTFRLTSASRPLLEKVAELYGGTVQEWTPQGGGAAAWEVVTTSTRIPILVPPQPISQWYEFWTAGGCKHRCDGRTNVLTDEFCDPDDPQHKAAIERPTTRLNVVLAHVEGIGVWRLETHGFNAAVELPDAAEFLAQAGGYVRGWVSLEARTSKAEVTRNGETKTETRHFMVPIIEIDVTPAELMAGGGRVQAPVLEGPVAPAAIAGPSTSSNPGSDPYAGGLARISQATSLDDLTTIWAQAKAAGLVGTEVPMTPQYEGFVDAFKARAAQVQAAAQPVPDADGAVDAELVDDGTATAVWQEILECGGALGMGLGQVQADFLTRMGVSAAIADIDQLRSYLNTLGEQGAATTQVPA